MFGWNWGWAHILCLDWAKNTSTIFCQVTFIFEFWTRCLPAFLPRASRNVLTKGIRPTLQIPLVSLVWGRSDRELLWPWVFASHHQNGQVVGIWSWLQHLLSLGSFNSTRNKKITNFSNLWRTDIHISRSITCFHTMLGWFGVRREHWKLNHSHSKEKHRKKAWKDWIKSIKQVAVVRDEASNFMRPRIKLLASSETKLQRFPGSCLSPCDACGWRK